MIFFTKENPLELVIAVLADVAIITAGLLAIGFWAAVIVLLVVELIDNHKEIKSLMAEDDYDN